MARRGDGRGAGAIGCQDSCFYMLQNAPADFDTMIRYGPGDYPGVVVNNKSRIISCIKSSTMLLACWGAYVRAIVARRSLLQTLPRSLARCTLSVLVLCAIQLFLHNTAAFPILCYWFVRSFQPGTFLFEKTTHIQRNSLSTKNKTC